jgi:hypothetical protein
MTPPDHQPDHNNSNRRKLEFQTGVTERIGDRALSTSKLTLAYTPHHAKGCSPR